MDGEPEAQLTAPFAQLIRMVASEAGLDPLTFIRETRQGRIRPDFGVLAKWGRHTRFAGWVELKAPNVSVDASTWTGRSATQWEELRKLDVLLVSNGKRIRLYRAGQQHGPDAELPYNDSQSWRTEPVVALLRRFLEARPLPVTSVRSLAERLALRTADLRDRILWLVETDSPAGAAAAKAFGSWRTLVHPECSVQDFADGVSQVVAYGMVLAVLSTSEPDKDHDGRVSIAEAREAIRQISPVMAAAFGPLVDKAELFEGVQLELGALESLASAIDPVRVNESADQRGEPWLYFYEDFLSVYDATERRQAGVYYTPTAVVRAMVRMADHLLVHRFRRRRGFGDVHVVTLDPATGTGTFPLAVVDRAAERLEELRGAAGKTQSAMNLWQNLIAFELLPGPYSVAHLRLSQRLRELDPEHRGSANVILTDTLESPLGEAQLALFGDADVLAQEQNRARRVKAERQVTVIIGNPPYRRVERNITGRGSGGWVVEGQVPGRKGDKSLFDDILDVAKKHTIFSHQASLYNLYVYFWRWALWKAMEAHGAGPRIVAFITASSWLTGPGFVGLRKMVRELCDEIWVLDLGGDSKGAHPEENIFAIETPVAVVVLVRDHASDKKRSGITHYRRVEGTAAEKLATMDAIAVADDPFAGAWEDVSTELLSPLVPVSGDATWQKMPMLADLFPWQQPGCKFGRTWPIAPHPDVLKERWAALVSASAEEKPELFVTAKTGRSVTTKVAGLPQLAALRTGAKPRPIVRYGYRSFDRQWAFDDPRLAALERPALWRASSPKQVFLTSLMTGQMSAGPCVTVTAHVPDLHHFRGSFGGKDVMPLYRDAAARNPNVTAGLLQRIGKLIGIATPTPEDLAAYVYALLSSPRYQQKFCDALRTPGPRVPITRNAKLWTRVVKEGKYLIWLHTFAERMRDVNEGRCEYVASVPKIGWRKPVSEMPPSPSAITYDERCKVLRVGDGEVAGVTPEVWEYSVSGFPVVKRWLAYRTASGAGRAANSKRSLDKLRIASWPDEWNDELLDLLRVLTLTIQSNKVTGDLLDKICGGPLINGEELPKPKAVERRVPKV